MAVALSHDRQHHRQLALPVQLPVHASFATFVSGKNEAAVSHLRGLLSQPWRPEQQFSLFVGGQGQGKSHLLCALSEVAAERQLHSIYLPLSELKQPDAVQILHGLETYDLIVLDDVDAVTANREWAEGLFALINRLTDQRQGWMVMSAQQNANTMPIELADLRSRLQIAVTFKLDALTDDDKVRALHQHAKMRGLELPKEVGEFLLLRVERDMHALMALLDRLDKASMAQQRRLTVPFVKQVLEL
ncbi:MAG: DnaA regulatory inactivator Hda [Gammaproteobacteria bacterium]|nr:DnaA regulatory inactivator Hda [Gammaproteobacteria bacterium]